MTKFLLACLFPQVTLAGSSLSQRPRPANYNKQNNGHTTYPSSYPTSTHQRWLRPALANRKQRRYKLPHSYSTFFLFHSTLVLEVRCNMDHIMERDVVASEERGDRICLRNGILAENGTIFPLEVSELISNRCFVLIQ